MKHAILNDLQYTLVKCSSKLANNHNVINIVFPLSIRGGCACAQWSTQVARLLCQSSVDSCPAVSRWLFLWAGGSACLELVCEPTKMSGDVNNPCCVKRFVIWFVAWVVDFSVSFILYLSQPEWLTILHWRLKTFEGQKKVHLAGRDRSCELFEQTQDLSMIHQKTFQF